MSKAVDKEIKELLNVLSKIQVRCCFTYHHVHIVVQSY